MKTLSRFCLPLAILLVFAACASKPQLEPRRGGNPEQVDLSGNWKLQGAIERQANGEQMIRLPKRNSNQRTQSRQRSGGGSSKGGTSLHVFVEYGNALKVTQTDYGLFFSFDRAVVEEYNFGEFIPVSVGPISGQRASGWDGPVFITETMDEAGNVLTESWRLESDGEILARDLSISRKDEQSFFQRQRFERE